MAKAVGARGREQQTECVVCQKPAGLAPPTSWRDRGPRGFGLCGACRYEWPRKRGELSADEMVLAAYLESVGESPGAILARAVLDHRRAEYQRAVDEFGDKSRPSAIVEEMRTTVILRYMNLLRAGVAWAEAARDAMSLQQFWGPYLPTRTREIVESLKFKSAKAVKTAASRYRQTQLGEDAVKYRAAMRFFIRDLRTQHVAPEGASAASAEEHRRGWQAFCTVMESGEAARLLDAYIAERLSPSAIASIEASLTDRDSLEKSGAMKLFAGIMKDVLRRSEPR